MKAFLLKPISLILFSWMIAAYSAVAQRVVTGTVYKDGKVQAGVIVEGQKSNEKFMTSFDGVYTITVPEKCKYLKFTFITDSRKLDIENNSNNVIDFSFDGVIPVEAETNESGVIPKTAAELIEAKDKDFMSDYTLEKQFYDQKDYKSAITYWRKLNKTYPKSTINIYLHGINIYQSLIEDAKDHKIKSLYVDSLMQVYDRRIKYFDQKGYVLGRQGTDYLKYKIGNDNLSDDQRKEILEKGHNYLDESVKLQGDETEAPVLILLMNSTIGLYALGDFGKEKVVETYDIVSKIINNALKKNPTANNFIIARDNIDQFFQNSGAADCVALINIYSAKYDQISNDVEELKKMLRMLDRQNCDSSALYSTASEKLYKLEPSAEAAYNMARTFVKANQLEKAQSYYKLAIDNEKDQVNLAKYYFEMATLSFTSNPQLAKTYLKKSIENNPNVGKTYVLLGDLYAHNSKSIGENDFEHSFVFMVAVDYYNKAKKVDPSVAAEANEKINTYSQYFPSKEDIFFYGKTVGETYNVGGWVGENTIIRSR